MIFDAFNLMSDDQAVTTGVQLSDVIDLGVAGTPGAPNNNQLAQDIAKGRELPFILTVTEAFASGTSLLTELVNADDAALTTNDDTLASSGVVVEANLTLGSKLLELPAIPLSAERRFLGVRYTTVGTHTAGEVHGGIVAGLQTNQDG
jgi:hypothetical protein